MRRRDDRRAPRLLAGVAVIVMAVSVAACSGQDDPAGDATGSTSPAADPTPAAREQVEDTFDGWWAVYTKSSSRGSYDPADLQKYLVEPALSTARKELDELRELNIVFQGTPRWTTLATSVRLDAKPPAADLQVCYDQSKFKAVDADTKEDLSAPDQLPKYRIAVSAQQADGRWRISKITPQRDQAC